MIFQSSLSWSFNLAQNIDDNNDWENIKNTPNIQNKQDKIYVSNIVSDESEDRNKEKQKLKLLVFIKSDVYLLANSRKGTSLLI